MLHSRPLLVSFPRFSREVWAALTRRVNNVRTYLGLGPAGRRNAGSSRRETARVARGPCLRILPFLAWVGGAPSAPPGDPDLRYYSTTPPSKRTLDSAE